MKPVYVRCLVFFLLLIFSSASISGKKSEYGDIIKKTPEYKEITKEKYDDHYDNDRHDHHYYYPYYYPYHYPYRYPTYPHSSANYDQSAGSERSSLPGIFYLGIAIGESEFDYNDIENGDATIFHVGYRQQDSHLGYELSFYDSGDAEVTSLTGIELQVDSINLALTLNSSLNNKSTFNLFGLGGIYLADTTLSGPAGSVSESNNGFLLAVGIEVRLNQHFSLRAAAYNLNDVEDFANDESISIFSLGGQFIF